MKNAVFLSIEGLGTNLVGAYGNSVCPTPNMDKLASQSVVLDQLWTDSTSTSEVLLSWWTGQHRIQRNQPIEGYSRWREILAHSLLVTDCPIVAEQEMDVFDRILLVEEEADDTQKQFERLVEAAVGEWTDQLEEYPILWIHSRGLSGRWDAPYEYRMVMCDEGDPEPPAGIEPMELQVTDATDPDEVFQIACAVGGQVLSMDQTIGELMDSIRELNIEQECLVAITGIRGFPLGEHGRVGGTERSLYAETLHVPCLLRFGNILPLGIRASEILQPHEVGSLLDWWFSDDEDCVSDSECLGKMLDLPIDSDVRVGAAIAMGTNECHVTTPSWSCRFFEVEENKNQAQLYAKPDDRWEQNEVSQRATVMVDKMTALRDLLIKTYRESNGTLGTINWVDDSLIQLHR